MILSLDDSLFILCFNCIYNLEGHVYVIQYISCLLYLEIRSKGSGPYMP
jgi:hypothetical protein